MQNTKYIFVIGGVMSSVGKGVASASIGTILKAQGYSATIIKIDPYINVDAGTINPTEHGEVFVTEDGDETDQDIGNYEHFLDDNIYSINYMTTGRVYLSVIERERRLEYDGEDVPLSPELSDAIDKLARNGQLTAETFQQAAFEDMVNKTDWASVPVDGYVEKLKNAKTLEACNKAVQSLGGLISFGNRAAFDALCDYLKGLPYPETVEETHFRVEILRKLKYTQSFEKKLARLLVEDLFRTPSNNTTRSWYTAVFRFFENSSVDIAEMALSPMLDSPQFSYRIKKRVKTIISRLKD